MTTHNIYVLVDPRTEEIRYVGQTRKRLEQRLAEHLREQNRCHKSHWLTELKSLNMLPAIRLVEAVDSDCWQEKEVYWIEKFTSEGYKLTNNAKGGRGRKAGWYPTEETRQKMRESAAKFDHTQISEEARSKIREAALSRSVSEETRRKLSIASTGRMPSEEVKKKIGLAVSAALKGHPVSEETRAKLRESNKGKVPPNKGRLMSEEQKKKLSIAQKKRFENPEECARNGHNKGKKFPRHIEVKLVEECLCESYI